MLEGVIVRTLPENTASDSFSSSVADAEPTQLQHKANLLLKTSITKR